MKKYKEDENKSKLRDAVSKYLDNNVITPSLETVDRDFFTQARLAALLVMVKNLASLVHENGTDFNNEYLCKLSKTEINRRLDILQEVVQTDDFTQLQDKVNIEEVSEFMWNASSKKPLLAYLTRELNWITISILSASYVSSLILMRAVFELIIGIASRQTGKMSDRIEDISFLDDSEKKMVKQQWYRLCAWGHPYGKWIKEICPIYSAYTPVYHQALCEMCMKEFMNIVGLITVVVLEKYEIEPSKFTAMIKKFNIDVTGLELVVAHMKS